MSAGLHLVMALTGEMSVTYADCRLTLSPPAGGSICALVALLRSDSLKRIDGGEGRERKLILWASHDWLADAGLSAGREHLSMRTWVAGQRLHGLADAVVGAPHGTTSLSRLRTECRVLDLLAEALGGPAATADRGIRDRMQAARELLDSGAANAWSLADIALELGLHENTLQRRFRQAHGCTVFDYLRRRRLEEARMALQDGATVTDAALAAGYGNPANFATAFKRMFGQSPRSARLGRAPASEARS